MPTIYLRKDIYDELVKSGKDPNTYVNNTVEAALKKEVKQPDDRGKKA
ncbi:MAG: hypothetical protein PHI12_06470 [Dehalococcoidales bacterium]|nr:hypothetical protein [Dehalococcoidales bacterium]